MEKRAAARSGDGSSFSAKTELAIRYLGRTDAGETYTRVTGQRAPPTPGAGPEPRGSSSLAFRKGQSLATVIRAIRACGSGRWGLELF